MSQDTRSALKSSYGPLERLSWGTHLCNFYRGREDLAATLFAFLNYGLQHNQFCICCAADPLGPARLKAMLADKIPEIDLYIDSGQLEIHSAADWYLEGGTFSKERVLAKWDAKLQSALRRGFTGVRATGNVSAIPAELWPEFFEYEAALGPIVQENRLIVLCSYPVWMCDTREVAELSGLHDAALSGGQNKEPLLISENREKARLNRVSCDRSERIDLLSKAAHELLTATDPDAATRNIFGMVAERLELDAYFNFLVNDRADALQLGSCAGVPEETARRLTRLEFGQAVCGTVALTGKPMEVADIQHSDDPKVQLVKSFGIRAYACNPLIANGRMLGTLSFATRRRDRFSPEDLSFFRTICHYVAVARERLRIQAELQKSEDRYRAAVEGSNEGLWDRDLRTNEIFLSRQWKRMLGYEDHEIANSIPEFNRLLHPEDREKTWAAVDAHLEGQTEHFTMEMRLRHKDGSWRWILSRGKALRDEHGVPYRMAGSHSDITDLKRAEQALREADRRKDQFLAMLGHELRNPMSTVTSAIELLKRPGGIERAQVILPALDRQSRQLSRIIDDLLDVSRVSRGKISLRRERIDLKTLVLRAVDAMNSAVQQRRHELVLHLPSESLLVNGDPTRLEQVLINLIGNAIKYTKDGGLIEIGVAQKGALAALRVKDNGVGIARDKQEAIFEFFVQLDESLDRSYGGLGIGLPLAKKLVEIHGGTISVHSDGPGRGSEFRVTLPLEPEAVVGETSAEGEAALDLPYDLQFLVIDDNEDACLLLRSILEEHGHRVTTASDGAKGLELALQLHPDVILLDIGLPGLNGYEVAQAIRRHGGMSKTQLIALTGYGQEQDRKMAVEAGFDQHLMKPARWEAIARAVREFRQKKEPGGSRVYARMSSTSS